MKRLPKYLEVLLNAINHRVPRQEREAEVLATKLIDELDSRGMHPTEHLHAIDEEERHRRDRMN